MPNTIFRFKQFAISQVSSAMKVSTDGCLFGSWITLPEGARHVLDAGCGTGLLSLMVAQRHSAAVFTAIEIDPDAAAEARANAAASPFADRIAVVQADLRTFPALDTVDAIICNPPFFRNSLNGPDPARNMARHADSLGSEDLLQLALRCRASTLFLLLPHSGEQHWRAALLRHGWTVEESLYFRTKQQGPPTGLLLRAGRAPAPETTRMIRVQGTDRQYSEDFRKLLAPYYLAL